MTQKIAIFGAGGFAREVLQIILDINDNHPGHKQWLPLGFVVDPEYVSEKTIHGLPILGSMGWLAANPDVKVVIAIGSPAARKRIARQLEKETSNALATLIHPKAWLGGQVHVEAGAIICAGALISTDIQIGKHVHINLGCTIGHDAELHDFATLNPGVSVSGHVKIASGVELGTQSVFIPGVEVGEWSIIGAGAVVTQSLPPNVTAVGVPAKVIRSRQAGWHRSGANGV